MINHLITLRSLSEELNEILKDTYFDSAFTYHKNQLQILFSGKTLKTLFFNGVKGEPYLFLKEGDFKPKKKQTVRLFEEMEGKKLSKIEASSENREINFHFGSSRSLIFTFYGSQPNAILLNDQNDIINSFKTSSELIGRNFDEIAHRNIESPGNPEELDRNIKNIPSTNLLKALRKSLPFVSKSMAAEIAYLAWVEIETKSHNLRKGDVQKLWEAYKRIDRMLSKPKFFIFHSSPPLFSLLKLKHMTDTPYTTFNSVNETVIEFLKLKGAHTSLERKKRESLKSVNSRILSIFERIKKQKADLIKLRERRDWNKIGDLVISNLHLIKKGMSKISLNDFEGNKIEIALDPLVSPSANAAHYYKKSKSARSGEKKLLKTISEGENELPKLDDIKKQIETANTLEEWDHLEKKLFKSRLKSPRRLRKQETPSLPYRSFDAPGGYTVLVGKSAKNNDELTFRIAKKNDLWLHAQGSGGSHVVVPVIKKGEPFPREVIVRAAQLAARHSKQKHSAIVPVIYTLCKYVWKKKGGPPGTVHVKKEKSLMVKL